MSAKRTYTVPILLVIITVMTTMVVMLYSKQLIGNQTKTTEEGKRLAEQYTETERFAERLWDAADLLLKDASPADRLRANHPVVLPRSADLQETE